MSSKTGIVRVFKALKLSPKMAKFMNAPEATRPQVQKAVWAYIKNNKLQLPEEKTWIRLDSTLQDLFPAAKDPFSMYQISTFISEHITIETKEKKVKPERVPPSVVPGGQQGQGTH